MREPTQDLARVRERRENLLTPGIDEEALGPDTAENLSIEIRTLENDVKTAVRDMQ